MIIEFYYKYQSLSLKEKEQKQQLYKQIVQQNQNMSIINSYFVCFFMLLFQQSLNQLIKTDLYSRGPSLLPYNFAFNSYMFQNFIVSYKTTCPNLRLRISNIGNIWCVNTALNDGLQHTYICNVWEQNGDIFQVLDLSGATNCQWQVNLHLSYSCSKAALHCYDCTSPTVCISCLPGKFLSAGTCSSCGITNCLACINPTTCTQCNSTYAVTNTNVCQLCANLLSNCYICSDRFTCTSCVSTYAFNSTGDCASCSSLISNCNNCTNNLTCTLCIVGYIPIAGACQACTIFMTECLTCTSSTTCTSCLLGFIIDNLNKCKSCSTYIPNCFHCTNNLTCSTCLPGFILINGQCKTCAQLFPNCDTCFNAIACSTCLQGYILDSPANNKCVCESSFYNVSNLCIDDPNCVNAYKQNGKVLCSFCNLMQFYVLNSIGRCQCKESYEQVNHQCQQKCGDGIIIKYPCDDNNTENGDGCSSTCQIQPDFECSKMTSGVSSCKFIKDIKLEFDSVWKILPQNKGKIHISLSSKDQNILKFYKSPRFNFNLTSNRPESIRILNYTKNDQGQIVIEIQYNETIEDSMIELIFSFSNDSILSNNDYLKFYLKGSNYPLIISAYTEQYEKISEIQFYFILCAYFFMLLGLSSNKFIGVEAFNSLQLIFFSLLTLNNNNKWPQSFSTLLPLKFSTGFNQLLYQQKNNHNLIDASFNKYRYLGISESFLYTNFSNCVMLFAVFIVFIVFYVFKTKKENKILDLNHFSQKRKQGMEKFRSVFRKVYNFTFHFGYIMILQVFVSLFLQISYVKQLSSQMTMLNNLSAFWTSFIVIITILQNFNHLFLSDEDLTTENYQVGSREKHYKRVYLIYLLFNTMCIALLNNKLFFGFPVSGLLLIVSLLYFIFLIIYRPYKNSFLIHAVTIVISHLKYVLMLTMITILNLKVIIDEFYLLIFSYTIMGFIFVVVLLTIVRVVIDFKYDAENVAEQIKHEMEINKQVDEKIMARQVAKQISQKEITEMKKQQKNSNNPFIYANKKMQNEQTQFLDELKKKFFLSEWEIDQSYYRIYDRKPLQWVQENEKDEKIKLLLEKERQRYEKDLDKQHMDQLKKQKAQDKTYLDQMQNLKNKLRNQCEDRKKNKKLETKFKDKNKNSIKDRIQI